MKMYEVVGGTIQAGVKLSSTEGTPPTISLGQEGRGRKHVMVPLPSGTITENGRALDVPSNEEADAVCVCVRDHSGYRGGWRITDPRTKEEWMLVVREQPAPERRAALWRELAKGYCAQGDAGRMGGGPEYLAVLRNGQAVEIVREGRLYGKPSCFRIENRNGELIISVPRREIEAELASSAFNV